MLAKESEAGRGDGGKVMQHRYGKWWITHNPKPIPTDKYDWDFVHDLYDGPGDSRCGTAASVEDARKQIREIECNAKSKTTAA